MVGRRSQHPEPETSREAFAATQWSLVIAARRDPDGRQRALERLCQTYWLPIYSYLRRRGHSPADAEDITQGFFAHLLGSDFIERPDPTRGRFRSYLIGALKQFIGHQRERESALKRGGGIAFVAFDHGNAEEEFAAVDQPQLDPSEAYELAWAIALLARAQRQLEAEQAEADRLQVFTALKPFLHAAAQPGDYERAAAALGTSRATVAVWLHRLNQRLAELVKIEVTATLEDPANAEQELLHLLQVLRR